MSSNSSELLYIPAERKHARNPLLNAVDGGISQFSRSMLKQDNIKANYEINLFVFETTVERKQPVVYTSDSV